MYLLHSKKNNEYLNFRLLCYLCNSYYKPYSKYCQLIIVLLIWQETSVNNKNNNKHNNIFISSEIKNKTKKKRLVAKHPFLVNYSNA